MKKKIMRFTLGVGTVVVSCIIAWQAYDVNNATGDMLLVENVEALSDDGDKSWLEKLFDGCYDSFASLQSKQCMSSQTNISLDASSGVSVGAIVEGLPINIGISNEINYNYSNTKYNGQSKWECESGGAGHCDRREQTNCEGQKCGSKCCS